MRPEWRDFSGGVWEREINVRDFIQKNYTPYDGDDSFLAGPTQATKDLWAQVMDLSAKEREAGGVLDMDTKVVSTITSHGPDYLDQDKEKIVGLQTDKAFKRSLQPYGGIRMAEKACADNGYTIDPEIKEFFTVHRKTHNAGVFDAYTPEMRACRSNHIITGLPDAYGRGRRQRWFIPGQSPAGRSPCKSLIHDIRKLLRNVHGLISPFCLFEISHHRCPP